MKNLILENPTPVKIEYENGVLKVDENVYNLPYQDDVFVNYRINNLKILQKPKTLANAFNTTIINNLFGYRAKELDGKEFFIPKNEDEYLFMFKSNNIFQKIDIMIATMILIMQNKNFALFLEDTAYNKRTLASILMDFKMYNYCIELDDSDFIYKNFYNMLKEHGLKNTISKYEDFVKRYTEIGSANIPYGIRFWSKKLDYEDITEYLNLIIRLENETKISLVRVKQEVEKYKKGLITKENLSDFFCWKTKEETALLNKFYFQSYHTVIGFGMNYFFHIVSLASSLGVNSPVSGLSEPPLPSLKSNTNISSSLPCFLANLTNFDIN